MRPFCAKCLIFIFLFAAGGLWGVSSLLAVSNDVTIYFYSSETNVNNFKSLKMEFDRYLSGYGRIEFQPFIVRETFEKHAKSDQKCLIIISSWHYRIINKEYSLQPVLVGLQNGHKFQKRVLVTMDQQGTLDTLTSGPIASASSPQHTKSVLEQMIGRGAPINEFNILTVPKDIDALMAVGFGMAKSALTSQNGFEQLRRINPELYKKMKILRESEASLSLILAVPKNFEKASGQLVNIVKEMGDKPLGREKIKMLGIDGWQELDDSDSLTLEAR